MRAMEYVVVLTPDEGDVLATVPDLPNVIVTGQSEEDATARVRVALADYLEELARNGIAAPPPAAKTLIVTTA